MTEGAPPSEDVTPIRLPSGRRRNARARVLNVAQALLLDRVHMLHVSKTGGTAVHRALRGHERQGRRVIVHHGHGFTIDRLRGKETCFYFLRDPVSRFASGFNDRLRQGRPRYDIPWTSAEQELFERFTSADALASALSSQDSDEAAAAATGMDVPFHTGLHYTHWLGEPAAFHNQHARIAFVGFQETLDADFEVFKQVVGLPKSVQLPGGGLAHRAPVTSDRSLSDRARSNLRRWYAKDYELIELSRALAVERGWREPSD